jgi:hypothetical protein
MKEHPMGYKRKRGLDLEFPDSFTDASGEKLAVCIASGTMEEFFTVREVWRRPLVDADTVRAEMAEIYDILEPKLVSWNLEEDDGAAIPFTRDTLAAQDRVLVATIVDSWLNAVEGVSRPLVQPSPAGEQSVVASIPTEPLSPAQAS